MKITQDAVLGLVFMAIGLFALFMWWRITTEQVQKARESAIAERQVA